MNELLRILRESLPQTIGSLFFILVMSAFAFVCSRMKMGGIRPPPPPPPPPHVKEMGVLEAFRPALHRGNIAARVHTRAVLRANAAEAAAFEHLNQIRRSADKIPQYSSLRYRVVCRPTIARRRGRTEFCLDLAEIDFIHFALLNEPGVDSACRRSVLERVRVATERLPKRMRDSDLPPTSRNTGLLGVQMVLLTSDGYTLLRRRGFSVLENPGRWDVSFSGYTGTNAFENGGFDIGTTTEFEFKNEVGSLPADPRHMRFTGIHFCEGTGTTVMLGYWAIEATATQLGQALSTKYKKSVPVFDTTTRASEKYVWDTRNMIVGFDAEKIAALLKATAPTLEEDPNMLVPAARASLVLSLHDCGRPTLPLELEI